MREIKFRAWDNVNKVMLSTAESWLRTWKDSECDPDNDYDFKKLELYISRDGHVLEDTYDHGVCDLHYYLKGKPKYELMQYTGLKDKNGVESYWDDIVDDGINPPFVITPDYHLLAWLSEIEFKVIGNIHKNPELLKGQDND